MRLELLDACFIWLQRRVLAGQREAVPMARW
jgi:hypothetical protein